MTAEQKAKFLEAVDEIEAREGTGAPSSAGEVLGLFLASFPDLWNELMEPFARELAERLITARGGVGLRRRSGAAQMRLAFPGLPEINLPVNIRIPPATRKGEPTKMHRGRWGKTLETPVRDFGVYVRQQEQRLKDAGVRRREKLKPLREMYRIARAGAGGNLAMPLKDAIATQSAKLQAKAAGFGTAWLFGEEAAK